MKVVDQVCDKIRPQLTQDYQSGRFTVSDFRDLLKRIDFTPREKQYVGANFRFVITKLGLFHYLPEIQGNEDAAVIQLIGVLVEKMIGSGKVKGREEALNRLVKQIEDRVQVGASTIINVSEVADLRIAIQSLRENVTNFWEKSPEKIPEFIDRFRDDLSEISQSSRLLYDIGQVSRDLRSNNLKYLEDLISEIDSWEQRLHIEKQV